jgi:hypothetical protein
MDRTFEKRGLFLRSFVRSLINNSKPKEAERKTLTEKKPTNIADDVLMQRIRQEIAKIAPALKSQFYKKNEEEPYELTAIKFPRPVVVKEIDKNKQASERINLGEITLEKIPLQEQIERGLLPPQQIFPQTKPQLQVPRNQIRRPIQLQQKMQRAPPIPMPQAPRQKSKFLRPSLIEKINIFGFAKLDPLLEDPAVEAIECPGPDKFVLAYKSGRVQPTKINLTSDEISQIMKEISDKTRIPLTSGVFRASLHRFNVTAVLSEFVGTRFILQKKPGPD